MNAFFKSCLIAMLFSSMLLAQSGATYYVSTTGSDSNNGSYTAPWLTIQHAANTATAGATVYVEGGTYYQSVSFPNSGPLRIPSPSRIILDKPPPSTEPE